MPTIHLLVKGNVQGVFYRATAKKVADKLKLTGWIKNTKEGNVEITATGSEEQLNEFIKWCKKGPDKAEVEVVIIRDEPEKYFTEFEIIRR